MKNEMDDNIETEAYVGVIVLCFFNPDLYAYSLVHPPVYRSRDSNIAR